VAAISVGSVEVDVVPNARNIRQRMQQQILPAADEVGEELGRVLGRYVTSHLARAVVQGVTNGGRQAQAPAARQGEATGSTFARSLKSRLEAAMASLPEIRLRADSSEAERELHQIRAQMQALRDARIGIDVDTATATAAMAQLQARLDRLSASDADVQVRVDAAAASAQLAAFNAQVNRLDGRTANVDVDTRSAASNLHLLTTAALAFGPAILPVLPVVAAGLGAIAAAGAAAAAGIGGIALVAVPAFKQIGTVLHAQKAAQEAATNATARGGQAASQAASRSLQMASAQQSLATAERNGARQIAQAQKQVQQAKQAAADAAAQAAQRNAEAARRVQDAEDSLADAQRAARQAQADLTAARRTAAQELEDLNNRLADSVLSQRDAEIALKEATAQREAVLGDANATELDKQKALLAYDQAVQRLKEQTTETGRLKKETASANKAGVEGSATYKNAQQQLADAQAKVADQAQAVKDAQADAARTQVETARQVAEAQQRVGEATANVAVAQQNAADAVASAQRQIQSASLSAAGSVDQAAVAQAKYEAELAKLTPSARQTFDAFIGLRTAFSAWSKSLQPAVMPIFTRALVSLRNTLPTLTPFVKGAASAITELQDRASKQVKTPFWQNFKKDLQDNVKPAIIGIGVAFGNIFKGMAGIIGAFLPHMDSISSRMQTITGRFAKWGAGLKGSPEFEKFLTYASKQGPILARVLGDVFSALLNVGKALSPISGPILKLLGGLANGISVIAEHAPWLIQGIYAIVIATRLWTIAVWAWNAALYANPITLIIIGIVALIAVIVYAYNRFGWFKKGVQAAWQGIQTAAEWAWKAVAAGALWLWNTVLKPVFGFLSSAARIVATIYGVVFLVAFKVWWTGVKLYAGLVWGALKMVGAAAVWLWEKAISPVIGFIVAGFKLWWAGVKLYFKLVGDAIDIVGDAFGWLWEKAVSPVLGFITGAIGAAWKYGIKPVFDTLKTAVGLVGDAFDDAKEAIKTAWDKIKGIAKEPVQFIVDTVYNKGLVGVWNKVASAFGAPKLSTYKFAAGGVMPGYTPGRDVHRFVSPTGGQLELSGGEAIMRPEFTRAVGSGFVSTMNAIARSRGAQGIKAALAPALGGNPATPVDRSLKYAGGGTVQRFADGGIFGWIKSAGSAVLGAGSAAWNKIKEGATWLKDTLEASARAGVKNVVDPLLKSFPGMGTGFGQMLRKIPDRIIDALFGYSKKADSKGGGGIGGPRIQAALRWAKTQDGLPYQWGGNGNPSWDCSGFMSAIESVIRGQAPHRRWSTHAFSGKTAPPGWVYHGDSPFRIGITAAGVGHTAGTLGKTNVESRGGDGVIVGPRARGYNSSLFTSWYGFKPGSYDSGGYLQPGLNLAYNGTGRPEPVFTRQQANALLSRAATPAGPARFEGDLFLDSGEWLGRVRGEAQQVMQEGQQRLISVINAT
jgi:phage-related protein